MIMLSLGSVGLLYFLIVNGFHFSSFKGLVIALSHCYALALAMVASDPRLLARNFTHDMPNFSFSALQYFHKPEVDQLESVED